MGQFMGTSLVLGAVAVGIKAFLFSCSEIVLVESVHCIMSEHGIHTCVCSVSAHSIATEEEEEEEAESSSSFLHSCITTEMPPLSCSTTSFSHKEQEEEEGMSSSLRSSSSLAED